MRRLLVLLLLAGCTTQWHRAGATQAEADLVAYECSRDAGTLDLANAGWFAIPIRQSFLKRCMRVHGYEPVE